MSQFPRVAVVILNYNGLQNNYLPDFLPSVYASTYPNMVLYVADNASTDGSVTYLKQEGFIPLEEAAQQETYGNKYLIALSENYWFAGGYNRALKQVQADYYILLNSDVRVAPDWIEPMVELLEKDPQIAACQPKIRLESEPYLFEHAGAAGGYIDCWGYPFCRGRIFNNLEEDRGQHDTDQEIFWASGAALFIRAACFHNFGGFDEDFAAHMEEIDLCWRLKRGNYKIMVCTSSVVWHVGGGTLPKSSPHKTYLNFRNSLGMVYNNETSDRVHKVIWMRLLLDGVAGARFLFQGEFKNIWAIVRAHWHYFAHFKHRKQKRALIAAVVEEQAYQGQVQFQAAGRYEKSIVWAHFVEGKQVFGELEGMDVVSLEEKN